MEDIKIEIEIDPYMVDEPEPAPKGSPRTKEAEAGGFPSDSDDGSEGSDSDSDSDEDEDRPYFMEFLGQDEDEARARTAEPVGQAAEGTKIIVDIGYGEGAWPAAGLAHSAAPHPLPLAGASAGIKKGRCHQNDRIPAGG